MTFESDCLRPDCGSTSVRLMVRQSSPVHSASLVQRCSQCERVLSIEAEGYSA
jgi:hypothetical protein